MTSCLISYLVRDYIALVAIGVGSGEIIGPALMGVLIPAIAIPNSCFVIAGLGVAATLLYSITFAFVRHRSKLCEELLPTQEPEHEE
jgi:phosphotransferase system  glucose/maltose/N-acetylglucosamine-specific IIC component